MGQKLYLFNLAFRNSKEALHFSQNNWASKVTKDAVPKHRKINRNILDPETLPTNPATSEGHRKQFDFHD
jgi:hypothetical protein